jgi:signal transduction histidine kinase
MNGDVYQDSPAIASMSLEEALLGLWREIKSAADAPFRILVEGRPKTVPPAIQEQICLIGREALINALRHSDATSIEVEVQYLRRRVRVVVRDNGCGFDAKVVRAGRDPYWGLLGMRERAESMGAQLQIWSRPGAGTEVEVSVPGDLALQGRRHY